MKEIQHVAYYVAEFGYLTNKLQSVNYGQGWLGVQKVSHNKGIDNSGIVSYLRKCKAPLNYNVTSYSEALSAWQPRGNRNVFTRRKEEGGSPVRILLRIAGGGHSTSV